MIHDMRQLNLDRVLRGERKASEYRHLLGVIESTYYASLTSRWTERGLLESLSPDRRG